MWKSPKIYSHQNISWNQFTSVKKLISRNFCEKVVNERERREILQFPQHSVEKWKICCHPWKISSNQLFGIFFGKNVTFTKFLSKKCDSKFPQFSHCVILSTSISSVKMSIYRLATLSRTLNFLKGLAKLSRHWRRRRVHNFVSRNEKSHFRL